MAIYRETPPPFDCAICGKPAVSDSELRWGRQAHCTIPPICWRCEQGWAVGKFGDANPDRRVIKHIAALAEALRVNAHRIDLGMGPING